MAGNEFVTAFAPASIGNVAVGFDMLGLAISGAGDRVSARRVSSEGVTITEIRGLDGEVHTDLSNDARENTASVAAVALWDAVGAPGGLELKLQKGIPLQSGMGSSSASAVAGAVAANALLDSPLPIEKLLPYALEGEKVASGGLHADNVAPSLIGGLVLCPRALLPRMISLPTHDGVCSVILHPELLVNTAEARKLLADTYSAEQWQLQQGYLAGFMAGMATSDIELIRASLHDVIIEPQRSGAVPCFDAVKAAALGAGALGSSLGGSGPSLFALCENDIAANVAEAMEKACRAEGFDCQSWVSPLSSPGAYLEDGH